MSISRTHRIAVYDPPEQGDPYVESAGYTLVANDIPANLQPLTGDVRQTEAGRRLEADWKAFVPPEYADVIRPDRVVVVLEGQGPTTYRIRSVGPHGPRWDVEALLGATDEVVA